MSIYFDDCLSMCWLCDLHRLYTDLHRLCGLPFSEFVVLFLCNAQRSDILNVKQRKQLRRKGAHCIRTFFFRRGCARMRLSPKEILSLDKSIWNSLTTEGQEVYRNGVPMLGQQLEQRFILEVQEHVMGKCYLTHGPKVSTSSSSCTRTKSSGRTAISSAPRCII